VKRNFKFTKKGFSVVEVIIAAGVLSMFMSGLAAAYISFNKQIATSGNKQQAVMLAEEGLEAARNIRDNSFSNLIDGTYGVSTSTNQWAFSGSSDKSGIFTRQTTVSTISSSQKQVLTKVNWQDASGSRSVTQTTYLTNWQSTVGKGAILVYGNGTTTSDSILYRTFDSNGTWSSPQSVADIDGGTMNRYLRSVHIYSSSTRNEKIMISRHYDGLSQYIYGQVYNGTSWGNVQLLASWIGISSLNQQNFDGAYLNNGDFMVVLSDNTLIPKMQIWNGSLWGSSTSLNLLLGIPNWVVVKARPGTNEVMVVILDQGSNSTAQYFNGGSYITASWSAVTTVSNAVPSVAHHTIDFAWSPNNPLIGAMIYAASNKDQSITAKIWTANGIGGGSFSAATNSVNQSAGRYLSDIRIAGSSNSAEFETCDSDITASPSLFCYKLTSAGVFSTPINSRLAAPTDSGSQRAYDIAYESTSGFTALNIYSDNTSSTKLKKYNVASTTWDSIAITVGTLSGNLKTVVLSPYPTSDDIMIVMADANQNLYTALWDGTNNQIYTTPIGKTFTNEGNKGSNSLDYWFDFAWDNY
jgi:Tfp pilus assembly protein PilV